MKHIFDVDIATEYDLECAIILENLNYWISKNEANETNYFDGYYWTFNSIKAFKKIFPYMSEKKIYNCLNKLESEGIIITGNYNKLSYDRTKWYAITEKGKSILLNGKMEFPKKENGFYENDKPIPNINTDIKQNNKQNINKETYVSIVEEYSQNETLKQSLLDFVEMRKKQKGFTTRALKLNLNNLDKLAQDDQTKIEIVNQTVMNSWKGFYELKNNTRKEIVPSWYDKTETTKASDETKLKALRLQVRIGNDSEELKNKIKELEERLGL